MKKLLLIVLMIWGFVSHAQIRRFEIAAGIGNNNQVENVLDEYFYPSNSLYLLDESESAEASTFKYNITGRLYFNSRYSLRLRYGHAKINNDYDYYDSELKGDFEVNQIVTNINPAFCISEVVGRFNFSTGIEFAFYKVKDYSFYFDGVEYGISNNVSYSRKIVSDYVMEGGKVTGINNFIDIEFSATSRLGIGVSASYGMMFAKFGDQIRERTTYSGSSTYTSNENKNYKRKYFSAPEVSVYAFLRFGKGVKIL